MYNNYPADGSKKVCTVTAVDITRKVCKCMSDLGEILSDVRWLVPTGGSDGYGSSYNPVENSRVLVDISSGFPFILGSIPCESADAVRRPNIGRQDVDEPQIADYTTIKTGDLIRGPGTPHDQRVGDIINTTDGGAIQGVLSSGTVINKASPLSQIICSRYGDIVRVVARNYERFSDVDKEQKTSIRGNLYTRSDLYRSPAKSREEIPNVVRYSGNVQAAELIHTVEEAGHDVTDSEGKVTHSKHTYATIPVDEFPAIPEDDYIVEKIYIYNDEDLSPRVPVSTETTSIEGQVERKIQTTDTETKSEYIVNNTHENMEFTSGRSHISTSDQTSSQHKKEVKDGLQTNWWMNETEFHWDVNEGGTFIHGDAEGVVVNVEGQVVVTYGSDGKLTVTNTGDTEVVTDGNLSVTAEDTTLNLNNLVVNTKGTTTFESGGNFTATAPIISLN